MIDKLEGPPTDATGIDRATISPPERKLHPEYLRQSAEGARREFVPTDQEQSEGAKFDPLKAKAWRSAGELIGELQFHLNGGEPLGEDFFNAFHARIASALYAESSAKEQARIAQSELDIETRVRGDSNIRATAMGIKANEQSERAELAEEAVLRAEARALEAERIANENETTHLPNHRALQKKLEELFMAEDYRDTAMSILYLDVEGLGLINDTISHAAGDYELREVARILAKTIRDDDLLFHSTEDDANGEQPHELETGGRLYHKHGDELQILLNGLSPEVAQAVGQRVVDALQAELLPSLQSQGYLLDRTLPIACGVGVASKAPGEMKDPEQIMHEGDIAMKTSKRVRQSNIIENNKYQNNPDFVRLPTSGIIIANDGSLPDPGYVKDKSLVE